MTWVNYRATLGRFRHIDAEFVRASASLTPDGGTAEVVVRLYPWWEHPLYLAARERGGDWGFASYERGMREVAVRAIRPFESRLSARQDVIEWAFTESHPLLWSHSERSTIYVNAPFEPEQLIAGLLALQLPHVMREDLLPFVSARERAAALTVPAQLHAAVCEILGRLGIPIFSAGAPKMPAPAVVFLMDGTDYVLAEDFEVDVPEFVHDPAWFRPASEGAGSGSTRTP